MAIGDPRTTSEIPALCERVRLLLHGSDADRLVCDVHAIDAPDAVTLDALAQLQLLARRHGCRAGLRNASPELRELLCLAGLADVVPCDDRW